MIDQHCIIDTNFILRYLLADNKDQYKITCEFFKKVKTGRTKAIVKDLVIAEVVFVLSSYYEVPRDRIAQSLCQLLPYKGITMENKEAIIKALAIYANTKLHIVDAILASHAQLSKTQLLTFDKKLKKLVDSSN
jgi:predicted nucleic-acid-binding protein